MSTSPAGSNAGRFQLCNDHGEIIRTHGVSGNARQRRRQVRDWKSMDFTVMQFNFETRASRFKR